MPMDARQERAANGNASPSQLERRSLRMLVGRLTRPEPADENGSTMTIHQDGPFGNGGGAGFGATPQHYTTSGTVIPPPELAKQHVVAALDGTTDRYVYAASVGLTDAEIRAAFPVA